MTAPGVIGTALGPPAAEADRFTRRDELVVAFFSSWVVGGLFLDGWAHHAGKAETFFSPWHAVMYSGFGAALGYAAVRAQREWTAGRGIPGLLMPIGFALFLLGGLADMGWHQAFGVEVDIEALLSPTHLMLAVGGLLLITTPIRSAWSGADIAPGFRTFLPVIIATSLAVSVVGFFLHFATPFHIEAPAAFAAGASDTSQAWALSGFQLTNILLVGASLLLLQRWRTPPGTYTVIFGGHALLMAALGGFAHVALALPAVVAGMTADVLVARGYGLRAIGVAVPLVLWPGWFAGYALGWGLGWAVELWTGTVVMAALAGYGLSLLAHRPAGVAA